MNPRINQTGSRGGELSYDSVTYIEPDAKIIPKHDYLVVEPLGVEHSQVLTVIEDIKPVRGVVKAVGPGVFPLCYDSPDKSKRTKMWRSKTFRPTQIKVGDVVELGSIRRDGRVHAYSFQSFMWGNVAHIMCREEDVSGVVCDE